MSNCLERLQESLKERVSLRSGDLSAHSRDEGVPWSSLPAAVVFAQSVEDVLTTLEVAREFQVPLTPWGAGTSLEGAVLPPEGGISLDLSALDHISEPDPLAMTVQVGPGVRRMALNQRLRPHGLFFSVDPGADASLGGMAATNASGTTTVKYGGMRENVLAMQVALADGRLIKVGSEARKSSSGYALKHLFIGSEGTLGVITSLTLRLHPLPAHLISLQLAFASVAAAVEASVELRSLGLHPERLELVDAQAVASVNRYHQRQDPEQPTLWVELAGRELSDVHAQAALLRDTAKQHGAQVVGEARTPEERTRLWTARHSTYDALRAAFPGHSAQFGDVCVPLSQLSAMVQFIEQTLKTRGLTAPLIGHIGDGNLHLLMHAAPDDQESWATISDALHQIALEAIRLGGTCTGEHGVGLRKRAYLAPEHGEALGVMRELKGLLDPLGILNPGKVVGEG